MAGKVTIFVDLTVKVLYNIRSLEYTEEKETARKRRSLLYAAFSKGRRDDRK